MLPRVRLRSLRPVVTYAIGFENRVIAGADGGVYRGRMDWYEFKDHLSRITDLDQDALHIYAAVLLQIAAAALLRRSLASIVPWLIVLVVLGVNEWGDLREPGRPIEQWQVIGGLKDIWNTMAIPTMLLLLGRYLPWLATDRANHPYSERSPSRR